MRGETYIFMRVSIVIISCVCALTFFHNVAYAQFSFREELEEEALDAEIPERDGEAEALEKELYKPPEKVKKIEEEAEEGTKEKKIKEEIIKIKEEIMKGIEEEEIEKKVKKEKRKRVAKGKKPRARIGFFERADFYLRNLHPYLEYEEIFNSNIYRTHDSEKRGLITRAVPGARYEIGDKTKSRFYLLLDGGVEFKFHARNNRSKRENPYVKLFLSRKLNRFSVDAFYNKKRQQVERAALAGSATRTKGNLIDYVNTNYGASLKAKFNRLILEPGYSHTGYSYKKIPFKTSSSYIKDIGYIKANLKVFPKTFILAEYNRGVVDYYKRMPAQASVENDSTNTSDLYRVGLIGKISPKLNGSIRTSYEYRDYSNQRTVDLLTFDAVVFYKISRFLNLRFNIVQKIDDYSHHNPRSTKNSISYSLGGKYTLPLNKKISLTANTLYRDYDYEIERNDKLYQLAVVPEYQIKEWMKIVGNYNFKSRTSNTNKENEYNTHVASLKFIFEF